MNPENWSDRAREGLIRKAKEALAQALADPGTTIVPLEPHLRTQLRYDGMTGLIDVSFPDGWVHTVGLTTMSFLPQYLSATQLAFEFFYREMRHAPSPTAEAAVKLVDPFADEDWRTDQRGCCTGPAPDLPGFRRFYSTVLRFPVSIAYPEDHYPVLQCNRELDRYAVEIGERGGNAHFWIRHEDMRRNAAVSPEEAAKTDLYGFMELWLYRNRVDGGKTVSDERNFVEVGEPDSVTSRAFRAPHVTWRDRDGSMRRQWIFFESQRPHFFWLIVGLNLKHKHDTFQTILASFRWLRPEDLNRVPAQPIW